MMIILVSHFFMCNFVNYSSLLQHRKQSMEDVLDHPFFHFEATGDKVVLLQRMTAREMKETAREMKGNADKAVAAAVSE